MPYYDVAKLVTGVETNVIDEMPCGYGTLWTTAVIIFVPSLPQTCAEVPAAPKFDYPISQISEHLWMLFQSLRALCLAPGGPRSICKYLEALVRATRVSGWFACGFRTDLHFADVVDCLGLLTTLNTNLATVQFGSGPGPKVTVQNRC